MAGQDGGEWNQVKRKGGRLRSIPALINEAADSLVDGIRPNPKPELSVNDLWRYHESVTQDSQTTQWWEQVRQQGRLLGVKPDKATQTRMNHLEHEPNRHKPT